MGQRSSRSKRGRHGVRAGQTQRERELRQRVRDLRELVTKMADGATERAVELLAQNVRLGKLEAACRTAIERIMWVNVRLQSSIDDLCGMRNEAGERRQVAMRLACDAIASAAREQVHELAQLRGEIKRALDEPETATAAPAQAAGAAVKAGETKAENYALLC